MRFVRKSSVFRVYERRGTLVRIKHEIMSQGTLSGFSQAAKYLEQTERSLNEHQRDIITNSRQPALEAAFSAWQSSQFYDSDGEATQPVSHATFRASCRLIESLPLGFPSPTVTAEPDGHLNLEWYKNPRRILSVSISPTGTLHWAALIGSEDPRGSCRFLDELPQTILYWIGRVYAG